IQKLRRHLALVLLVVAALAGLIATAIWTDDTNLRFLLFLSVLALAVLGALGSIVVFVGAKARAGLASLRWELEAHKRNQRNLSEKLRGYAETHGKQIKNNLSATETLAAQIAEVR